MSKDRYFFTKEIERALNFAPNPFGIYQFINKQIIAVYLSKGFVELFGLEEENPYQVMDHDTYRFTHPDDVARVSDAVYRFATMDVPYNVIYRTRTPASEDYFLVHANGKHIYTSNGSRLGVIWFMREGMYNEKDGVTEADNFQMDQRFRDFVDHMSSTQENYFDRLTGLPNMNSFYDTADAFRARIRERGGKPAMMYFDLNGMKRFNKQYGFVEGDELIRALAELLRRYFGNQFCARIVADHFLAVADASMDLEPHLRKFFYDVQTIHGGNTLPVSVGIYIDEDTQIDSRGAADRAKFACDQQRNLYGSSFTYYDKELEEKAIRTAHILDNLDTALSEGWIHAYYQPIIRIVTGQVSNEEALARWIDPEEGLLSPAEFIPALEEAGLLYKLDLYMIDTVVKDIKRKEAFGFNSVPVSVNLSWSDFKYCDILKEICTKMDAAGIPRRMLDIEITESVISKDPDFMRDQIRRFHEAGFSVWMDDFGSGYSSLDVLQKFDFDLIKFDMQFMRDLEESEKTKVILTELNRMAVKLGCETVFEGVETEDQIRFLREIGCDRLQGFYYGRPLSVDTIRELQSSGSKLDTEDQTESSYYDIISLEGLNDPAVNGVEETVYTYFSAVPMGVLEQRGDDFYAIRYNKAFADLLEKQLHYELPSPDQKNMTLKVNPGSRMRHAMELSGLSGNWEYAESASTADISINAFVRKLAQNPKTGAVAYLVSVMSMMGQKPED